MVETLEEPCAELSTESKKLPIRRGREAQSSFDRALMPLHEIDSKEAPQNRERAKLISVIGSNLDRESFDSVQTLVRTLEHTKALLKQDTCGVVRDFERDLRLVNLKLRPTFQG